MANVLLRNIPDEVLDHYRAQATVRGMSVNAVLREAVERGAEQLSVQDRLARIDALRATLPAGGPSSVELIRMDRDSR
jgi:plasmid stability protein